LASRTKNAPHFLVKTSVFQKSLKKIGCSILFSAVFRLLFVSWFVSARFAFTQVFAGGKLTILRQRIISPMLDFPVAGYLLKRFRQLFVSVRRRSLFSLATAFVWSLVAAIETFTFSAIEHG
jgi:hypothetical protein